MLAPLVVLCGCTRYQRQAGSVLGVADHFERQQTGTEGELSASGAFGRRALQGPGVVHEEVRRQLEGNATGAGGPGHAVPHPAAPRRLTRRQPGGTGVPVRKPPYEVL